MEQDCHIIAAFAISLYLILCVFSLIKTESHKKK